MVCPNIDFCPARVTIDHYKEYCLSGDKWKSCKFYRDWEMTPGQWKKMVGESVSKSKKEEFKIF